METNKTVSFIEESFLKSLLVDKEITDISFNGRNIFYQSNRFGRKISDILINQTEARNFLRQISNLTERQFSYQAPILDVSVGKYRINAVHQSIGRVNGEESVTFCIRVASEQLRINESSSFFSPKLVALFDTLITSHQSIVIGGITGTGKTELQKWLLSRMNKEERAIVIDNVLELEQIRNNCKLDMNYWQYDDKIASFSLQTLIRNALRSNPDWLIVAEARGAEMNEVLTSALTGHPIITTIHSYTAESIPERMTRLVMMGDKKSNPEEIEKDISYHFHYFIHLSKETLSDGSIRRFIDKVVELLEDGTKNIIYEERNKKKVYRRISNGGLEKLNPINPLFLETFGGDAHE